MSIYNAWVDRAPVIVVGGTDLDASNRPPGVPTIHSGQDINALVRDFTKWDDTPVSLAHFAQSVVRAYKFAMTPPHEPVMIALDAELQEMPVQERERNRLIIPKFTPPSPPQAEVAALRETAKLLVAAQSRSSSPTASPARRTASSIWSSSPSCCRRRSSINSAA